MYDLLTILNGEAVEKLRELPTESVQCCVTSPPYWGLRDYGTAAWEGGESECKHEGDQRYYTQQTAAVSSAGAFSEAGQANIDRLKEGRWRNNGTCVKCGAVKNDSQLGLEKTPEEYVAKMVEVFREVRRVLRKDGTLWLNLGDSYAGGGNYRGVNPDTLSEKQGSNRASHGLSQRCGIVDLPPGLKPKDLCGIPWRVAFALQADGWWLRSDIIWAKPNPMPESVTDRPTKAHEYLFLLTKSASYFYDAEAIKEKNQVSADWQEPEPRLERAEVRNGLNPVKGQIGFYHLANPGNGRNKRSVWTVATAPYPKAHFATYPPDLIKPCIMAGSRVGDTVPDPFAGSGTTGMVALELGRKAVLIELNPKYVELIKQRCTVTIGLAFAA